MIRYIFIILFIFPSGSIILSQDVFSQDEVNSIRIIIPDDSLTYLYSNILSERYLPCTFIIQFALKSDTVENTGIRLRGNTSRNAKKKSFKISFNEFVSGRKFNGLKKLNLNGQHNDPTMIREKLFYDCWKQAGLPERRTAFVKLYINEVYYGLYTQLEELDKEWLERNFSNNNGNLYKCTYPADLRYLGPQEELYKNIMSTTATGGRAYDLKTNEAADDYSGFVQLIYEINRSPIQLAVLESYLDVYSLIKAYAMEVCTGQWDDYAFNKNNYFLYQMKGGPFTFISYDADNTFGIDYVNIDWSIRDPFKWYHPNESRPLIKNLIGITPYKEYYEKILDSIARFILNPDLIFPKIDTMHLLISDAAITDSFRTLDYHYTISDFHNGFTQKIDNHSPYGIKPFIDRRRSSILKLTDTNEPIVRDANYLFRMVYNSMTHTIEIETDLEITNMELYNVEGCRLFNSKLPVFDKHISVKLPVIETRNIYIVRFISKNITISKLELFK